MALLAGTTRSREKKKKRRDRRVANTRFARASFTRSRTSVSFARLGDILNKSKQIEIPRIRRENIRNGLFSSENGSVGEMLLDPPRLEQQDTNKHGVATEE